jgi:hypothetical protein
VIDAWEEKNAFQVFMLMKLMLVGGFGFLFRTQGLFIAIPIPTLREGVGGRNNGIWQEEEGLS